MQVKKWRDSLSNYFSQTKEKLWNQTQNFFWNTSHQAELWAIENEIKSLTPSWQATVATLMQNSQLKRNIELPPQDELLAKITWYSYLPPEKRPYQIGDFYLEPIYNSIFHCIYLNHKEKICIIAYRGTDFKNTSDLISDAQIILWVNAIDPRVTGSIELFDQVRKSHQEYQKRICGHSLGWTLCYIVAKHRQVDYCCTFNPGSAPNKIFILMLKDTLVKKERTTKIHTYKILWDIVSLCSYVGQTVSFFVPSFNPGKLHTMDNFFKPEITEERTEN